MYCTCSATFHWFIIICFLCHVIPMASLQRSGKASSCVLYQQMVPCTWSSFMSLNLKVNSLSAGGCSALAELVQETRVSRWGILSLTRARSHIGANADRWLQQPVWERHAREGGDMETEEVFLHPAEWLLIFRELTCQMTATVPPCGAACLARWPEGHARPAENIQCRVGREDWQEGRAQDTSSDLFLCGGQRRMGVGWHSRRLACRRKSGRNPFQFVSRLMFKGVSVMLFIYSPESLFFFWFKYSSTWHSIKPQRRSILIKLICISQLIDRPISHSVNWSFNWD